jgi:hypothetical protein
MAKGVQLRGIDSIMRAFENLGLPCWSLVYDGNQNAKFEENKLQESQAFLRQFLEMLSKSGSNPVYLFKVFEFPKTPPKGGRINIKASTEADYSYYVQLFDYEENQSGFYNNYKTKAVEAIDEIKLLRAEFAALKKRNEDLEKLEEIEEPKGLGAIFEKIAADPRTIGWLQDKIFSLADQIIKPNNNISMNKHVGSIGAVSTSDPVLIDDQQAVKVNAALEILGRVDAQLGDHLYAIADVAQKNPQKYIKMIEMLNTFL